MSKLPLSREQADALMPAHMLKWERMHRKYDSYGMAARMIKTEGWRKYIRKYPLDFTERWGTVLSTDELSEYIADDHISVLDEASSNIDIAKIIDELTPKQRIVWDALVAGKTHAEIREEYGFKSAVATRYHKHKIKGKFYEAE